MKETEKRCYNCKEFRAVETTKGEKNIEGHAVVFNQPTTIGGAFIELIEYGAFDGCDLSDVALFVNHDRQSLPLARTTSGTLAVTTDSIGLAIRAKLDVEHNPDAKALYHSIARGDVKGMSFAFTVADDEWKDINSEMPTRCIKKIAHVFEVSACTYPAYEGTDISARAKVTLNTARQVEDKFETKKRGKGMDKGNLSLTEIGKIFKGNSSEHSSKVNSPYSYCEARTMMVTTPADGMAGNIAVPTFSANTITPSFNSVSSLIDSVSYLKLQGGWSFKQPYSLGVSEAGYTDEGEDAAEVDNQFGFAEINQTKITAYAELTEELQKLPDADYANCVFDNIRTSIRQLLTKEILFGKGFSSNGHPKLVGILDNHATAIDPTTDLSISQITDVTLDEILMNYAGKEEVETPATLILSKRDLMAFSKVRSSTREKFYQITFDTGNSGRISGVPFIINSNLKPLTVPSEKGGAASGEYCMVYGNPKNYSLVEFSPLEVKRSDDYKFRKGITCFRGTVYCGGNVTRHNGFLRIRRS